MIDSTFLRFILVGMINTIIGYSLMMVFFNIFKIDYSIAYLFSYLIGIVISFFLNRNFVFFSKKNTFKEFIKFVIAFFLSYGISYLILSFAIEYHLLTINFAFILGMIIYSILFYLFNRYIIFT